MMTTVGLDGTTSNGSNRDLDDPIRLALRDLGFPIADVLVVTDNDLVPITDVYVDRVLDGAELRALETCWANWPYVTSGIGNETQNLSDLANRLQKRIDQLIDKLRRPVGVDITGGIVKRFEAGRPRNNQTWGSPLGWPQR